MFQAFQSAFRGRDRLQSLPYGFQNEIMDIHVQMGDPKVIGSDVPNLMKDLSNFVKDIPNFVKDVPGVPNCVLRWESTPNHFLMGSKIKSWTIYVQMGDLEAI